MRNYGASSGISGGAYFIAFFGAAVYFVQQAHSFGDGLLGILKAIVWPAVLLYHVLGFLHA
ncbi:MAG: hypothetical protein E6I22_03450 [Chloroflexi bacterium]|nr:MAG: hypothetical protein E6I22_03450 [Chloroflexota bacterium]TMG40737.1 MAG: hypothetical protein E6H92_02025 [Chloroflexota bacterium]